MSRPSRSWLDYAIWAVGGLALVLFLYLGYAVWAQRQYAAATSPAVRAVLALEKSVKKSPQNAVARVRLAEAYIAAGRQDDAIRQYQAALQIEKENPEALNGLGMLAMRQKKWPTAEKYWHRVIDKLASTDYAQKDARLETAYYYLGQSLMEQNHDQDAVPYLKEALRIRPDAADTHYTLSVAYGKLGIRDKQKEELKVALAFDVQMPEANYDMALLIKPSEPATAAEMLRLSADKARINDKPIAALRSFGLPADYLARASKVAGSDPASATLLVRVAVAIDPKDPDALRMLASLYEKQKKRTNALGVYQKLLALDPNDKDAAAAVKRLNGGK